MKNNVPWLNIWKSSIISGILLGLAWPSGLDNIFSQFSFIFIFVAFIPLFQLELLLKKDAVSRLKLFVACFFAFLIWNIISTWWIWYASPGGAVAAIVANSLLMSIPWLLYHGAKRFIHSKWHSALFVCLWLSFEYIHLSWGLAWPWLTVGNVFAAVTPLVQWYDISGVLGGSLWVLMVNRFIWKWLYAAPVAPIVGKIFGAADHASSIFGSMEALNEQQLNPPKKRILKHLLILIFLPIIFSFGRYFTYSEANETLEVVVVQPNIDPYQNKFSDGPAFIPYDEQINRMIRLSEKQITENTAYVFWPETAIPERMNVDAMEQDKRVRQIRTWMLNHPTLTLITGVDAYKAYRDGDKIRAHSYNAAIQLKAGEAIPFYQKSKLVPGVEHLPYKAVFNVLGGLLIDMGGTSGGYEPQDHREVFVNDEKAVQVAPIICYESVFGGFVSDFVVEGANLFAVVTNDGWWNNTAGHRQHNLYSRLRCLENRRSMARSANTGISCFINERGDEIQRLGYWEEGALREEMTVNNFRSLYVRLGDIIGRLAAIFAIGFLSFRWVSKLTNKFEFRLTKKLK